LLFIRKTPDIAEGRRKKEEGRRKKENAIITVRVSVIKNVLTRWWTVAMLYSKSGLMRFLQSNRRGAEDAEVRGRDELANYFWSKVTET
jgi:hypothetical protein